MTGVIWWKVGISHYKALFRRAASHEPSAGYTKDFLQTPKRVTEAIRTMFGGRPPDYENLTYVWPGGTFTGGRIYRASDYHDAGGYGRLEVGQWTGQGAPHPWRIGDPTADPTITLPGDPDASIPVAANMQGDAIVRLEPWLVMVQLDDSQTELHLRAYLGRPPAELSAAGLDHVPESLRWHMTRTDGLVGDDLPPLWFARDDLRDPWRSDAGHAVVLAIGDRESRPGGGDVRDGIGQGYREADENSRSTGGEPFAVDPDERDRATQAHSATQNALAEAVRSRGLQPRSPAGSEPAYDVAWEERDGSLVVAEVKSLTARNAERQLRLALGQVLRYRHLLAAAGRVRALIVTSGPPPDPAWYTLCDTLGIGLIARGDLESELDEWVASTSDD